MTDEAERLEKKPPSTDHTVITLWVMGFTKSSRKAIIDKAKAMFNADPLELGKFLLDNMPIITDPLDDLMRDH